VSQELVWYTARASGIVAWVLVTAAVVWGLVLSQRPLPQPRPAWVLDLHRFLGGLGLVFIAVHIGAIAFDEFVGFDWADLFVPMASAWRPGAVAWGIVALYGVIAVQITSLLMRRLPRRVWHAVHLGSFVVFVATTVHALEAGSDASLLRGFAIGASVLVAGLAVVRVLRPRGRRRHLPAAEAPVYSAPDAVGVPDGARGRGAPVLAQRVAGDPGRAGSGRLGSRRDGPVGHRVH
jgi:hypothetical protein